MDNTNMEQTVNTRPKIAIIGHASSGLAESLTKAFKSTEMLTIDNARDIAREEFNEAYDHARDIGVCIRVDNKELDDLIEKAALQPHRGLIICGGFGKVVVDLKNIVKSAEQIAIETKLTFDQAISMIKDIVSICEYSHIKDNAKIMMLEKIKEFDLPKLIEPNYHRPDPKPHHNKHYQKHCRRSKW